MNIRNVLKQATREVTRDNEILRDEINCGSCMDWAEAVCETLWETGHAVEYWMTSTDDLSQDYDHDFVRIDGKFYDADCYDGVDDHMKLRNFKHAEEECSERIGVYLDRHNQGEAFSGEQQRDMNKECV